jgi:hypothetical protein
VAPDGGKDDVLASIREGIRKIRALCLRLQRREARNAGAGVGELWHMTADDDGTVFDLCRLLFRSRGDEPLRERYSLQWTLIGGARHTTCPATPFYVFRGVPFYIASGMRHAGLVESAPEYLTYCQEAGVWNHERYRKAGREELLILATELVEQGPWSHPLMPEERDWLLAQVPLE